MRNILTCKAPPSSGDFFDCDLRSVFQVLGNVRSKNIIRDFNTFAPRVKLENLVAVASAAPN